MGIVTLVAAAPGVSRRLWSARHCAALCKSSLCPSPQCPALQLNVYVSSIQIKNSPPCCAMPGWSLHRNSPLRRAALRSANHHDSTFFHHPLNLESGSASLGYASLRRSPLLSSALIATTQRFLRNPTMTRKPFELADASRQLTDRLMKLEPAGEVSYSELSELIGRDIRNGAKHYLKTARNTVRREYGIVTRCDPVKKCVYRVDHANIARVQDARLKHINRQAKLGRSELGCVDLSKLTEADKSVFNAKASHLSVLAEVTKHKQILRLEKVCDQAQAALPAAKAALEMFK